MKTSALFPCSSLTTKLSLILLTMMNLTSPGLTGKEPQPAPERPNILLILTDDQAWGDVSSHGNTNLNTPNMDRLGHEGARFDRFYVSPVCSPTRAEILTGRYHPRGGVSSTSSGGERMDLDEVTLARVLQNAGYATACFGKWHNGQQWPYHPRARGFDEFYGFCSGHWGHYFSPELEHNGELVRGEGYIVDDFTDHTIRFMEEHAAAGKPFFTWLAIPTPHDPTQVPDRFYEPFADAGSKTGSPHARAAWAMCENIDWNLGRLLEALKRLEIADDTIVVFLSDNGPKGFRWNGGMKGKKGDVDEGGVRVPCMIRWPGKISAGKEMTGIAAGIDLLPTLCGMAGIDIPEELQRPLDGVDLSRPLLSDETALPERTYFSHWGGKVTARRWPWLLDQSGQLFNLAEDPGQQKDLAEEHPELHGQLSEERGEWKNEVLQKLWQDRDERTFPVGYPEFPNTILPARDGEGHGNIQRSNRFPNSSFFENWIDKDDFITWNVEIATAGKYQATLHYTCPPENVGAVLRLSFGDQAIERTVDTAFDPEPHAKKVDRTPRASSDMKEFRTLDLGTIQLPAQSGKLELRAVEIPGQGVVDVRYLELRLL